jgi:hypothetical protein
LIRTELAEEQVKAFTPWSDAGSGTPLEASPHGFKFVLSHLAYTSERISSMNDSKSNLAPGLSELLPPGYEELLGPPPVLPFEDTDAFQRLWAEFLLEFDPKGLIEHRLVRDIVDNDWKAAGWSRIRNGVVELELPVSALKLIEADRAWDYLPSQEDETDDEAIRHYAREMGEVEWRLRLLFQTAYLGNRNSQKTIISMLSDAGVTMSMVQGDVYRGNIALLAEIDEQIAKFDNRRNQAIRMLEGRRATSAAMSKGLIARSRRADDFAG